MKKNKINNPVAWIRTGDDMLSLVREKDDGYMVWKPLYTAPPKREWVGLTDEEANELHDAWQKRMDGWGSFYQAIEARLKEKNVG